MYSWVCTIYVLGRIPYTQSPSWIYVHPGFLLSALAISWMHILYTGCILDMYSTCWFCPGYIPCALDTSCRRPYTFGISWICALDIGRILDVYPIRWAHPGYMHILDIYFTHWLYPGCIFCTLGACWIYTLRAGLSWIYAFCTGQILQTPLYIWYFLDLYPTRWAYLGCIPYTLGPSWIHVLPGDLLSTLAISWF